ncbi:MAG: DnaD domain protein [Chloroflexota bacterium]
MAKFNGFPPGELKFTSVPDLFFARLLPMLDDLAELKIILHVMWLRQRHAKQAVSFAELQTDETLINGLSVLDEDPIMILRDGLEKAVNHKAILHAQIEDEAGLHDVYLLNSEGGRQMLEEMKAGKAGVVAVSEVEVVSPRSQRANIFDLYEENIGMLSALLVDELKDAEATYPDEWIQDAFKVAVENNVRKWSYIRAVLERMQTEGREYGTRKQFDQESQSKRWFTDEELEHYFKH